MFINNLYQKLLTDIIGTNQLWHAYCNRYSRQHAADTIWNVTSNVLTNEGA
jgi:hypothetical protein